MLSLELADSPAVDLAGDQLPLELPTGMQIVSLVTKLQGKIYQLSPAFNSRIRGGSDKFTIRIDLDDETIFIW